MTPIHEIALEINVLVNSLMELLDEIHCTEAKTNLRQAQMWAEYALRNTTGVQ